jgi:hypothetical protein
MTDLLLEPGQADAKVSLLAMKEEDAMKLGDRFTVELSDGTTETWTVVKVTGTQHRQPELVQC